MPEHLISVTLSTFGLCLIAESCPLALSDGLA